MIAAGLLLFTLVSSVAGNCLVGGGCGAGACCSAYGYCGSGSYYCGGAVVVHPTYATGDCRIRGCLGGGCCSRYGYCGTSAEHCGYVVAPVQVVTNCRATGCPAGTCCSQYGYCGASGAHCGTVAYGNCGYSACGAGLCCTRFGYCGAVATYCATKKSLEDAQPASIDGEFQGQATYYNETRAGSDFSTCGIERSRSLSEEDQVVYTAALNQAQFDPYTVDGIPSNNPICQKKAIVKGLQGEIIVRFVDRCAECKEGNIGLTQEAFLAVNGEIGTGETNIEWHFI
ncbi:unnamed protein product [Rotaria magnacalcarata]|uniref:Chitin-binding type-1 domain-containing protein n=3 Tax=Rotaria magnacalcarata TaxID=392030 RepID=A0A820B1Q2_9BILA|nr:unnamed protein product [Rotaria magnacalcarata]CAF1584850.1 unnamed protein product [Rotaria magnacalcarata]CAF2093079.1 unnamed protein product [Rotaria magnacalcarata]CAF2193731.1 unnamed protein product [Rotaria magnacalcarata]CAF2207665.1 unnamed protein product [Rotaria magnacalcarata]